MNVHFPVSTVKVSIIKLELEGASVPNVTVAFGGGESILGPALDDPGTLIFVAVPEHQAAGGEAAANKLNSLADVGALVSGMIVFSNVFFLRSTTEGGTCWLKTERINNSIVHMGCPKKKCLKAIFSMIQTTYNGYFFGMKIIDKVLSLSKFWRHLANIKIVKIRHINGHISYIKQY